MTVKRITRKRRLSTQEAVKNRERREQSAEGAFDPPAVELDAEACFRARAALGSPAEGLRLLYELDRREQGEQQKPAT